MARLEASTGFRPWEMAVVKLGGAGRRMRRHVARVFERAAVFEVGGDAGTAKVWLHTAVAMLATLARRRTIAQALMRCRRSLLSSASLTLHPLAT